MNIKHWTCKGQIPLDRFRCHTISFLVLSHVLDEMKLKIENMLIFDRINHQHAVACAKCAEQSKLILSTFQIKRSMFIVFVADQRSIKITQKVCSSKFKSDLFMDSLCFQFQMGLGIFHENITLPKYLNTEKKHCWIRPNVGKTVFVNGNSIN